MKVGFAGQATRADVAELATALAERLTGDGHELVDGDLESAGLVFNLTSGSEPKAHWRREGVGQFGVTLLEVEAGSLGNNGQASPAAEVLAATYPALLKTMSNAVFASDGAGLTFITPEMGVRPLPVTDDLARQVLEAVVPLAGARFAIDNELAFDLGEELCASAGPKALGDGGRRLGALGLLPSPVALEDLLSEADRRLLKAIYGLQQVSYGNLSCRERSGGFWMSGRGVDKSALEVVGRDIFLVSSWDASAGRLMLRVPEGSPDGRVSVDAMEHAFLYESFPEVGAVLHVHAWLDGVDATRQSWPCGTVELAEEVLALVARQEDPGNAEVGLRNHGLTLTGPSLEAIFDRIEGRLLREIPPS